MSGSSCGSAMTPAAAPCCSSPSRVAAGMNSTAAGNCPAQGRPFFSAASPWNFPFRISLTLSARSIQLLQALGVEVDVGHGGEQRLDDKAVGAGIGAAELAQAMAQDADALQLVQQQVLQQRTLPGPCRKRRNGCRPGRCWSVRTGSKTCSWVTPWFISRQAACLGSRPCSRGAGCPCPSGPGPGAPAPSCPSSRGLPYAPRAASGPGAG